MTEPDLIAVDTAAVVAAGRGTAGTAGAWGSWASRCGYAFAEAADAVRDPRIALAATRYAVRVTAGARRVGQQVAALGADTVTAGSVVDAADAEAASALRRPVNRRVPG